MLHHTISSCPLQQERLLLLQQIFEGNPRVSLSRDPPAVSNNVISDGSIALQDNTVRNGIQNPTRKQKIKSTELSSKKVHTRKKNKATVGQQQSYNCSQLHGISIRLSQRIWQMPKRNDMVVYFCRKKQTG